MGLDDIDGLRYFNCHAFGNSTHIPEGKLMELSRKFVDYTRGNPLALKVLGGELRLHQKDEAHWESKLHTLAQSPNKTIQNILRISYDELSEQQKDAFLDVACFFRSENVCYVTSLVDSCVTECTQDRSEIRDLADKFLINISGGRVEMHDLLCTLGKDLGSQASIANKGARRRLWNHRDIVSVLKNKLGTGSVRGIFLDMSGVTKNMPLDCKTFTRMENLRYLKFYNSCCHRECETDCKLNLPDRLEFPLHEVRYLHWLKFPLEELPPEFNPKNLIDLRLPYSKIRRVWNGVKDTSKLKWVDLNHSSKLCELSGLVGAQNLQRLNLEGCTDLETLPEGMQDMKSLLYLNMRGCTRLRSLPEMKLDSLKTLILSGCSDLQQFQVISEKLEALYLDGTAIKGLPQAIGKLQRLVLLNLKCCKMLESLPSCLGELKALQELVLSGCSSLDKFPDVNENMNCLETLLLDGTAIKEMPKILRSRTSIGQASVDMSLPPTSGFSHPRSLSLSYHGLCEWPLNINGLYLLRRLCLSRNEMICSLQANISQLYHLKWLDLKYCKNLTSLPMLPPNLECLDAHGCDKLKTVASPLALFMLAEQIHSTFIFSNCKEMEQGAKDHITSYAQRKSQLISDALNRYNGGIVMEAFVSTCFPGSRVPSWFSHQVVGSVLERELPRHWCDRRLAGIALCAVVSFQHHQDQTTCFLVKCTCEFKNGDGSCNSFSCTVGGWSEPGNEPREIELDHVFIGYSSWLHIQKDHPEDHEKGCMPTDASFKFEVKDGTREVPNCKVLKCGFSLVYAPDEADNMFCEVNSDVIPRKDINIPVEARSSITSRKDAAIRSEAICHITPMKDNNVPSQVNSYRRENDIQSHSNFSLTPRRDYSFCSETNPYATPTRDDNLHGRAESHATLSWQNSIGTKKSKELMTRRSHGSHFY